MNIALFVYFLITVPIFAGIYHLHVSRLLLRQNRQMLQLKAKLSVAEQKAGEAWDESQKQKAVILDQGAKISSIMMRIR